MVALFPKDKGGNIETFEPMGKSQMLKGEPIKTVNYPFLVFSPNHLFLSEIGRGSYYMGMGRVLEKLELGRAPILEKYVFKK